MSISVINPTTNKSIATIASSSADEIREKISSARLAWQTWGGNQVANRVKVLTDIADKLEAKLPDIGSLVTQSMGMPKSMRDILDLEAGIEYFRWYLEHAEEILSPEVSFEDETSINTIFYESTGVAAVISPWNFPFCTFVWQTIPNLLVGNTVVFKPSSQCALVGKLLEEIFSSSSLPAGVFSVVYGGSDVGEQLIHEDIDLISFTGSTLVGKHIASVAAEKLIRAVLELGGSAPAIVFEDADMEKMCESVFFNRFANSGQICDGLKRLIVHESVAEKVGHALVTMLEGKKCGDPEDDAVEIGPLVSVKQADLLQEQVRDAVKLGATVLTGGKKPDGLSSAFFEPTILAHVTPKMRVWSEEVFGPVLPMMTFQTEEEAIKLANDTPYGLGGYILTEDKERARRVTAQMKTGMVSVNSALYLHPGSPFGGCKQSGIGREHGKHGFYELCEIKVVATEK